MGGSSGDGGAPYSAYGTRGANRPMVEGINVAGIFPTGFTLNFGSFDEVSVGTAVHGAEWPLPGVQMQFISKSGGNRYRGTLYADYEAQRLAVVQHRRGPDRTRGARRSAGCRRGRPIVCGDTTISTPMSADTSNRTGSGGIPRFANRTSRPGR